MDEPEKPKVTMRDIEKRISLLGTPAGDKLVRETLSRRPFPHFEAAPGKKGFLVRIEKDGTRSIGRFVDRDWVTE